jgi:hypothetical protein
MLYTLLKTATIHYITAQKPNDYVSIRFNVNYNWIFDISGVTIESLASNLLQF